MITTLWLEACNFSNSMEKTHTHTLRDRETKRVKKRDGERSMCTERDHWRLWCAQQGQIRQRKITSFCVHTNAMFCPYKTHLATANGRILNFYFFFRFTVDRSQLFLYLEIFFPQFSNAENNTRAPIFLVFNFVFPFSSGSITVHRIFKHRIHTNSTFAHSNENN